MGAPWKRRFLLETTISRFHVHFWGVLGVNPKIMGKPPKSSIFNRGFPWNKPSILGVPLFFGNTHFGYSFCLDLFWCLGLGIYIILYFHIAIIQYTYFMCYISWISGFIWHTYHTWFTTTFCLSNMFFFQNHVQQKNYFPQKTNMPMENHHF